MQLQYYLLILLVWSCRFYGIKYFNIFFTDDNSIYYFLFFQYIGIYYYKTKNIGLERAAFCIPYSTYFRGVKFLYAGLFMSTISPLIDINQMPIHGIWVIREVLIGFFLLYTLYIIRPSKYSIYKSLYYYFIIYVIIAVINYFIPNMLYEDVSYEMEYWESKYDKIFAFIPPGGMYVCIFMCVEIGKCIKRFTMKSFCIITLCLIFVFMDQNRTFLFPSLIVYIIGLLTYKTETKRKQLVLNLVVMLFVLFLILVMRESMEYLFEETVDNMNDSGGYRLIAWNYLTDTSHYTWYRCIFGRGWYSLNISDYYMKLGMNKIFLSDVGMFSFWFVYGLLSTLTIIYYYLNSILRKRFPLYLRLFSLISIFASFTVLYFQDFYKITFFVIFYYLYHLELTNFKKRYEGNSICIDACF